MQSPLRSTPQLVALVLTMFLPLLPGCTGGPDGDELADEPIPFEVEPIPIEAELELVVPEELMPAFEAVIQALEDGDQTVARGALQRVFARGPEGRALELARAFERILDGRELSASLDFRLAAEEQESPAGSYLIVLLAKQRGEQAVTLRSSGARLRQLLVIVDPTGAEQRATRTQAVAFPAELVVPVGETLRVELAELLLVAPAGLLALSSQLRLEILPGEYLEPSGRSLPAQKVPVEELELVRLAQFLPTETVEPGEVASYVARGRIYVPALMERVVRVAPARRAEALDALAPLVEEMSLVELELLVPGLRWLSRSTRPGGNPEAWRGWMQARSRAASTGPDWDSIDLPGS